MTKCRRRRRRRHTTQTNSFAIITWRNGSEKQYEEGTESDKKDGQVLVEGEFAVLRRADRRVRRGAQ